jgi:hypothetical protein
MRSSKKKYANDNQPIPENNPYGIFHHKGLKKNKQYYQSDKNLKLISLEQKKRKKMSKNTSKKKLNGENTFSVSRKGSRKRLLSNHGESKSKKNKSTGEKGN